MHAIDLITKAYYKYTPQNYVRQPFIMENVTPGGGPFERNACPLFFSLFFKYIEPDRPAILRPVAWEDTPGDRNGNSLTPGQRGSRVCIHLCSTAVSGDDFIP